ncbi:hypothetical protein HU675_0016120 [Bradyrhizobium septentrionale]|uniref:hypothetical protein n=1 Tax=Bradyrhizobium septentrionale TaxID=1404411 RepID=UPI001596B34C|nr:hypothetical protein [Bradyrhizobium septentrionale]UGY28155.1 hypothetical protein HU675_0016120 [Bradyrhizobium septentrionale]
MMMDAPVATASPLTSPMAARSMLVLPLVRMTVPLALDRTCAPLRDRVVMVSVYIGVFP